MRMSVRVLGVFILSNILLRNIPTAAQTVTVDATPSHVVNRFSPLRALGSTVDRVPSNATDVFFRPDQIQKVLSAGWGTISYRQNTDLFVQAWHWNPKGTWSDPAGKGYFTGDKTPTSEMIRHSYGYSLPHRGFTRNGGSEFRIQYWVGEGDAMDEQDKGEWKDFSSGTVTDGKGGDSTLPLSSSLISTKFVRVLMTRSSNTCDTHGSADRRNCVGYAIREL